MTFAEQVLFGLMVITFPIWGLLWVIGIVGMGVYIVVDMIRVALQKRTLKRAGW